MRAYLTFRSKHPLHIKRPYYFTLGSFTLKYEESEISFDFCEGHYGWKNQDDNHWIFYADLRQIDYETFPESTQLSLSFCQTATFKEIYYECYEELEEEHFIELECISFEIGCDDFQYTFTPEQLMPAFDLHDQ